MIPYSQKQKSPQSRISQALRDARLPSGTLFFLPSKELLGGLAPVNSDIVAVILLDLDPVNQLGDYQMPDHLHREEFEQGEQG